MIVLSKSNSITYVELENLLPPKSIKIQLNAVTNSPMHAPSTFPPCHASLLLVRVAATCPNHPSFDFHQPLTNTLLACHASQPTSQPFLISHMPTHFPLPHMPTHFPLSHTHLTYLDPQLFLFPRLHK